MSRVPDSRPRRGLALVLTLVVLAAAAAGYGWLDRKATDIIGTDDATFTARRGPLTISVAESGTIQAKDLVVIKSEVEGQTTIISLVDEGTKVKAGDVLIELDSAELIENRIDRQISVQNFEAAYIKAREDLAITKSQAESDIASAELDQRFAIEDLKKYEEGDYPRLVTQAEADITLALEKLENADETLRWSEKLFEEKYLSQTELDADRLAKNSAELAHKLAVDALVLLEKFTYKRSVDELSANVEQTDRSLERVKRKAAANIVQAEAELRAKESEFNRQKLRLEKLDRQIDACRMVAPQDGMVVYATTGRGNWRRDDEPLEEGQSVRERQELIHLPTTGSMMAEVRIHESSLKKVQPGQRVVVTIDALAGRTFTGTVSKISPLPDGRSSWLNPDLKEYPADIDLDGTLDGVRTGMSCRAEVVVAQLTEVVYIPVQAVVREGDAPMVYVRQADGTFAPREVEVGLDNNEMIHVESGLAAGEVVTLTPPLKRASFDREPPTKLDLAPPAGPGSGAGRPRRPEGAGPAGEPPARFTPGGGGKGSGKGARGGRPRGGGAPTAKPESANEGAAGS